MPPTPPTHPALDDHIRFLWLSLNHLACALDQSLAEQAGVPGQVIVVCGKTDTIRIRWDERD